jgi:uncharacterized protein (UPF0276 family)
MVRSFAGSNDLIGLGWRPELAASIHAHLNQIDVLEVIADNYFKASTKDRQSIKWLADQVPLYLHGVGLGMASAFNVDMRRVDAMAKLVHEVKPVAWSEHLSFVRARDVEVGHLAAPPRTDTVIANTARNVRIASLTIGSAPHLENIATLVEPLGSDYSEMEWIRRTIRACDAPLMLDLHNLYANAINNHRDPLLDMLSLPLHKVTVVHLSGGVEIEHASGATRLLDDHLHDVPEAVFRLLTALAQRVSQPLHTIIERDGHFPSFDVLREQLSRARSALKFGRENPVEFTAPESQEVTTISSIEELRLAQDLEYELATLYAGKQNFDQSDIARNADLAGMELAIQSYHLKRNNKNNRATKIPT